jgi:hypothetical protein
MCSLGLWCVTSVRIPAQTRGGNGGLGTSWNSTSGLFNNCPRAKKEKTHSGSLVGCSVLFLLPMGINLLLRGFQSVLLLICTWGPHRILPVCPCDKVQVPCSTTRIAWLWFSPQWIAFWWETNSASALCVGTASQRHRCPRLLSCETVLQLVWDVVGRSNVHNHECGSAFNMTSCIDFLSAPPALTDFPPVSACCKDIQLLWRYSLTLKILNPPLSLIYDRVLMNVPTCPSEHLSHRVFSVDPGCEDAQYNTYPEDTQNSAPGCYLLFKATFY